MAKKDKEGFHSAAGLVRYFDEEDSKGPKISPWLVVAMSIGAAVIVSILNVYWPT